MLDLFFMEPPCVAFSIKCGPVVRENATFHYPVLPYFSSKPQHFEENSLFHKIVLSGSKHFILCYNWIIGMKPCGMKCMITFPQRPFVLLISPANTVVMWPPELDVTYSWFFFFAFPSPVLPLFLVYSCLIYPPPTHTPKSHSLSLIFLEE